MDNVFHDGYYYTEQSLDNIASTLSRHYPEFDKIKFNTMIDNSNWKNVFIMKKIRTVALCLHQVLPESFESTVDILIKAARELSFWESIIFPEYIAVYGFDYWDISMSALTELTKHSSSEFAIRYFLIREPIKTASFLLTLTDHENDNVRRYASEGCRPSHPWGIGLPYFKKDPSPILPILERLKHDESEFVRKSVANNLNAISKDNPEIVLVVAQRWLGKTPETDQLVKHACRTLLKNGNRRALELFGYGNTKDLNISDFQLEADSIALGERIAFSFSLRVTADREIPVRLEFGIHFLKANGSISRKVYKISEKTYRAGLYNILKRTNHFIDRTTRTLYEGTHAISIIVNGEEMGKLEFYLLKQ